MSSSSLCGELVMIERRDLLVNRRRRYVCLFVDEIRRRSNTVINTYTLTDTDAYFCLFNIHRMMPLLSLTSRPLELIFALEQ